jgi:nucleoside-diphosphate-sugar epimerase
MNVYARSKYVGEGLTVSAADAGLRAHVCRFSNVYGAATDHGDRVAMAFARAAVGGGRMVVEGAGNIFDFTTIDDVVEGLSRLIGMIQAGENVPAVHFVSGVGTSLLELANIAAAHARVPTTIHETSGRTFDVTRFVGDPRRAEELLGWRAETLPMSGMAQLVSRLETFRG